MSDSVVCYTVDDLSVSDWVHLRLDRGRLFGASCGTCCVLSGHFLGTFWALSGHCLGIFWARSAHFLGTFWARSLHLLGLFWALSGLHG